MPKNNVGSLLIQQPIEFWAEIETRLKCASQEKPGLQKVYVVCTLKVTQQALFFTPEPDWISKFLFNLIEFFIFFFILEFYFHGS